MIIYTFDILSLGMQITPNYIFDSKKEIHYNVPCFVLREANREEYIEYCKETDCIDLVNFEALEKPNVRFYKISVD